MKAVRLLRSMYSVRPVRQVRSVRLKSITARAAILFVLSALIMLPGISSAEGYAGYAGAFLRMGAGAAAVAGGETGVARNLGVEQSHYNPAGLPYSPGNEIDAGYHILSLDRKLIHLGAMYQVKGISFWRDPVRPLRLIEPREEGEEPELVIPGSKPGRRGSQMKVEDYLDALATAILTYSQEGTDVDAEDFVPELAIDNKNVSAVPLKKIISETVPVVRQKGYKSTGEILAYLNTNYRTTREKPAAVALTWTHAATDNIDGRDLDGRKYGSLGYYENRFALSFGLKVHDKVSFGITAGVLYALIPDLLENETKALTSTTFGLDIGMQVRPFYGEKMPWRLETYTIGAAVYDIAAKNSWNTTGYWSLGTTKTDYYPDRYRLGIAYSPLRPLEVFYDLETDFKDQYRPKGGFEYHLFGTAEDMLKSTNKLYGLALRTGWDRDRPTFGIGLNLNLKGLGATQLDYAFVSEPVSPEPTQIINWRFRF